MVDHVSPEMREMFDYIFGNGAPFMQGEPVKPRDLTDADRSSWDDALNNQPRSQARTFAIVREIIKSRNRVRWWSLQRDFKWVQKEMKRMGLNPEDARWLL